MSLRWNTCLWAEMQLWCLSLQCKSCPWAEHTMMMNVYTRPWLTENKDLSNIEDNYGGMVVFNFIFVWNCKNSFNIRNILCVFKSVLWLIFKRHTSLYKLLFQCYGHSDIKLPPEYRQAVKFKLHHAGFQNTVRDAMYNITSKNLIHLVQKFSICRPEMGRIRLNEHRFSSVMKASPMPRTKNFKFSSLPVSY